MNAGPSSGVSAAIRTSKKSDVNDVRALLKDPEVDRDPMRKRDALRRVTALMTTGVDTSSLLPDVLLASYTPDLVSKKLIYAFLAVHSARNAELALLSINTLVKECNEDSPLVRGLALRSLASLHLPQLLDFLLPVLHKALNDPVPYVRRSAVLCTLKVYRISPEEFLRNGFFETMIGMLRDVDGHVCSNALEVLLEVVKAEEGNHEELPSHAPFEVTKPILYHLLNKMRGQNEWEQIRCVNLVLQYVPESEDEMFDLMNVLDDRLQSNHSGLVLACAHVFLHLTENFPNVHRQVLERIRQPLLTLMAATVNVESAYAVLCHVQLLVRQEPALFRRHYKDFFCRYTEPSYMKAVKMRILVLLAEEDSEREIVEELVAYTEDRNAAIALQAVEHLARLAIRRPSMARAVQPHLLECVNSEIGAIRGAALRALKDYLRAFPDVELARPFLDRLVQHIREGRLDDDESRVAAVWMLGEFGEHVVEAPYLLELMCERLLQETAAFRLQVLTSACVLFFKRMPEMQHLLGAVFAALVNDFSNADVLDRAKLYYRLLHDNPSLAAQVVCGRKAAVTGRFAEDDDDAARTDQLMEEFDTLSVVYGLPSDRFLPAGGTATAAAFNDDAEEEEEDDDDDGDDANGEAERREAEVKKNGRQPTDSVGGAMGCHVSTGESRAAGLLDAVSGVTGGAAMTNTRMWHTSDAPFGGTGANTATAVAPQSSATTASSATAVDRFFSPAPPPPAIPLTLSSEVEVEPEEYQRRWAAVAEATTVSLPRFRAVPPTTDPLEQRLEEGCFFTLASGVQGGVHKYYLYAQEEGTKELFMVELLVQGDGATRLMVKAESARQAVFVRRLKEVLEPFLAQN